VISQEPCSAERLQAAGFVAVSQHGYYGRDTSRIGRIADNVPVVFIRIGRVKVPAWIDTGFTETNTAGTVQVNALLLQQLRAAGVAMLLAGTDRATNCHGEQLMSPRWRVVGVPMQVTNEQDRIIFTHDAPALSELPKNSCSGPGNAEVPIARVGAAYVRWWGTLVLDSLNERVWLAPARARTPERPTVYTALAIASNDAGVFTVTSAPSLDRAKASALSSCNKAAGPCTLSSLAIDSSEPRCLAIARNPQNRIKMIPVAHASLDQARKTALEDCARKTGSDCKVEYSGCNS
jgi:hypothetical protein